VSKRLFSRFAVLFALCLSSAAQSTAQEDALPLQQTAEYDLSFDCPVASTFDPADDTFLPALAPLDDQWLFPETHPFAFTPDGALDILYNDADSYDVLNLRLTLDGEPAPDDTRTLPTFDTVNTLIPDYDGYLESTVYNPDHTLAAVPNTASFHIIDLQSGAELFSIDAAPDVFASVPTFSADGQLLYVTTFNNIDDMNDYSAVLRAYRLPGGDLLESYDVPSAFLWISPNGQYAVGLIADNQGESQTLIVTELETGRTSVGVEMYEPARKLTACVNDGRDMSDVDFTVSGKLPVRDITWLPDSSGFLTVQSYGGEAAGGGSPCFFNYSRLRHYSVSVQ
jgi:hypothetical protein